MLSLSKVPCVDHLKGSLFAISALVLYQEMFGILKKTSEEPVTSRLTGRALQVERTVNSESRPQWVANDLQQSIVNALMCTERTDCVHYR